MGEVDSKAIAQEGRIPEMVPEHVTIRSATMHELGEEPASDNSRAAITHCQRWSRGENVSLRKSE